MKEKIFIDNYDYARFLFLITHFQSPIRIHNSFWYTERFIKKGRFNVENTKAKIISDNKNIELLAFVITDNDFKLIIRSDMDFIPSVYMQRVLTAYGKYFNSKYKRNGHIFSGPFSSFHIKNRDDIFNYSLYIHKSPSIIDGWKDKYFKYPWSSCQDYLEENRFNNLLSTEIIGDKIKNKEEYKKIMESIPENHLTNFFSKIDLKI